MHLFGYRKSEKDKHKLVINLKEARIIERIFNEYDNGKNIRDIVKGLQEDKIPSPNNNCNYEEIRYKWSVDTIRRILANKVYLGHILYGKRINLSYKSKKVKYIPQEEWKIIYNAHEPIIDAELFSRVQNKRNINKRIRRKKYEWKLNGIVKCRECGEKMTLKVKYNKQNPEEIKSKKLYCLNGLKRYEGKKCIRSCKGINEEILNTIILQSFKKVVSEFINKQKLKELIINENSNRNNILSYKVLLNKELNKIENKAKTLYADYKDELLDKEDYSRFYKEIINEKNRIKKEIEALKKEEKQINFFDSNKLDVLMGNILDMQDIDRDIILDIIYDIEVDKENKIYIDYKYNIFEG